MLGRRSCRWRDSMSAVGGRDTTAECERVPGSMQMSPCGSACAAVMRGQGPARVGDLLKVIHVEKDKAFLFFLMSPSSHVTVEAGDRRESVYSERWLLQAVLLFLPSKNMGFYPFIQLQNKFSKKKKKTWVRQVRQDSKAGPMGPGDLHAGYANARLGAAARGFAEVMKAPRR